ncbi:MAG TPA: VOC family protein [Roseiflexaceae bacterium]|nr:VOC family protein [Roseiflexaceae bacterium]
MIHAIDHLVILVNDLDSAVADYATLGFTVAPGGEHTGGATHNALVPFQDGSYLELIAFLREEPGHRWARHRAIGEGLVDFALLPDAIVEDIAAARARGLEIKGPTPGGRTRPDGQQVAWLLGEPATPDMPFLCADVTPRELRVPPGDARMHANLASGIAELTVAVRDVQASAARYRALLGSEPVVLDEHTVSFGLGTARITLAAPASDAPADSAIRARLETRGEGPLAFALRAGHGSAGALLDAQLAHGVKIDLVAG